jgi:hypothetical protein
LLVDNRLILELKAVRTLVEEHTAQVLGYLKSARIEHGLLINFGSAKFEIKKYVLSQGRSSSSNSGVVGLISSLSATFAFFRG